MKIWAELVTKQKLILKSVHNLHNLLRYEPEFFWGWLNSKQAKYSMNYDMLNICDSRIDVIISSTDYG